MPCVAFVQSRMSSARFPGKVLAPFRGKPIIDHVVEAVQRAEVPVVVATSEERSDDPLAGYVVSRGGACFRGPLDDVLERFLRCSELHPCDWVIRICGDSPLLDPRVIRAVLRELPGAARDDVSLVTTTSPRTFPLGMNVEAVRLEALRALRAEPLTKDDCEHVTRFFHRHPERYRTRNVASGNAALAQLELAVDTVADLERIERFDVRVLEQALAALPDC